MSKKQNKNQEITNLPPIIEKYSNVNKLEENENKIYQDKLIIEKLKNENSILFEKLKNLENEYLYNLKIYEKANDEKTRAFVSCEEELNKLKSEKSTIIYQIKQEYNDKSSYLITDHKLQLGKLTEELENLNEKLIKSDEERKLLDEDNIRLKKENEKINLFLYNNIQSYELKLANMKGSHDNELEILKNRQEEFMKSNEEINNSDIYTVYKDIKKKFDSKLSECLEYKEEKERISEENKLFKLNLDNSDSLIKECSKVQMNQQKTIKHLKELLEDKIKKFENMRSEHKTEIYELNFKLCHIIEEKENEIKKLKNLLTMKNDENINLRSLSQIILDQRSEIEQFFIESLEEVKIEIFKRKKEADRKAHLFPNLKRKFEDQITAENSSKKVDIKELLPEDKEKVLRLLFSKINENYKPKSYKNADLPSDNN